MKTFMELQHRPSEYRRAEKNFACTQVRYNGELDGPADKAFVNSPANRRNKESAENTRDRVWIIPLLPLLQYRQAYRNNDTCA